MNPEPTIPVAFYANAQDNAPRLATVTRDELTARLTAFRQTACVSPCAGCLEKNGPAWSPVDLTEPRRSNAHVRALTAAVFDLDGCAFTQLQFLEGLERDGYGLVVHSSHRDRPGTDERYLRLVLFVSRPVLPGEWSRFRSEVIRRFSIPADPATKDLSRLYFLPSIPAGVAPVSAVVEGRPLDVDDILATAATFEDGATASGATDWASIVGDIPAGKRNSALTSIAGKLFAQDGLPAELVDFLVKSANVAACKPPLELAEVDRILNSIAEREVRRRAAMHRTQNAWERVSHGR